MDNKNRKSFAYYVGQTFAGVVGVCLMSIIVALTAKLVFWLIGSVL